MAVAGARISLFSQQVDDAATAGFMTNFYAKLKEGIKRGDALSATQKSSELTSTEIGVNPVSGPHSN